MFITVKLNGVVAVVQKGIRDLRAKYETISKTEEQDPITVESETSAGYFCQLMVDSKDAAKIMLEYDYPVWRVLEEEVPDAMWEDLGRKFNLESVRSVDL